MIDLHCHSTFSDGTYSPEEIINLAYKNKLISIALTDHDTINGIIYAKNIASKLNIEVINGIEFSSDFNGTEIHLLGYFIDINSKCLLYELKNLEETRKTRNEEIIKKLEHINLNISLEYVKSLAVSNIITKAHFAKAIVNKGYAKTIKDAFSLYLGKNKPAYVKRDLIPHKKAIDLIIKSGGIAVLAHPFLYGFSERELQNNIKSLKENGLKGVECYYPSNTLYQTKFLLSLCNKYNLKSTGGSDFHGNNRPNVYLGNIFLGEKLDYKILKDLKTIL